MTENCLCKVFLTASEMMSNGSTRSLNQPEKHPLIGVILLLALAATLIIGLPELESMNRQLAVSLPRWTPATTASSSGTTPPPGVLFIDMIIGIRPLYLYAGYPSVAYRVIPDENITITRTDLANFVVHARTAYNGLVELPLSPSDHYIAEINEPRFQMTTNFSIQSGRQTNLDIVVRRNASKATFQNVQDPYSSGWIVSPSDMFLIVHSSSELHGFHSVFVETETQTGQANVTSQRTADSFLIVKLTPISLVAQAVRDGQLWLVSIPIEPFPASGFTRMSVVTYNPTHTISIGPIGDDVPANQ